MMSVTDNDLELLETYLDDELDAGETDSLRRRIAAEPALAQAMDQLRRDRALRQQAFGTMELEPQQASAATDTIVRSIRAAATRDALRSSRLRIVRQISAAAACLAVGLLVGWFAHTRVDVPSTAAGDAIANRDGSNVAGGNVMGGNVVGGNTVGGNIVFTNRAGNGRAIPVSAAAGGFNVQITDDAGRVIAIQHFDTLNEAREFSNDFARWQNRQRQMRSGNIRLIGDDF